MHGPNGPAEMIQTLTLCTYRLSLRRERSMVVVSVFLNLAPGRIVASGGTSESTLIRPHLGNTDSAPSWRAIISRAAQNLDYTSCMHTSIGSTTQIPQSPSPLTTNQFHLENFHLSDLPA